MKKVIVALFGLASATLLGTASPAGAANINTAGADCHAFFTDQQASVNYLNVGMSVGESMLVQCPIPRGPLATGATAGSFFIDGKTPASTSTTCTVVSYNFDSTMEGSISFTETNTGTVPKNFDHFVSFPAAQMSAFAYVSLFCDLGAGGMIFGVTSLQ
jgi:hypothetical protein